jgi:two-component system CheB/CheR fusion protein
LVRHAVEDYRPQAAARHLVVTFNGQVDRVPVSADGARITQVIKNLLENALKHTPRGGTIDVTLSVTDRDAVLAIKDTGRGIPQPLLPQIFQPFFQGAGPVGSSHGGLGLGLALVKDIVERHDGSVAVQSEGYGKGSTFTVRLPLAVGVPTDAAPCPSQSPAQGKKILVVDDNIDSAESTALLLEMNGHHAEAVTSGQAALEHIARRAPDLVVCDLGMPGMDGYAVARALKASHPDLPLIALTGFAHPDDLQRAFQAGFDFHIAKPVDPKTLAAAVAEAAKLPRRTTAA